MINVRWYMMLVLRTFGRSYRQCLGLVVIFDMREPRRFQFGGLHRAELLIVPAHYRKRWLLKTHRVHNLIVERGEELIRTILLKGAKTIQWVLR